MNVTNKIKMDLSKPDFGLSVDAVQGDAYSRSVSIALYIGILPWHIPENVSISVRYAKPDRTKGYYDTLPNGERAWSYQENVLTVHLAPQMLTAAGEVKAQIELIRDAYVLSTFSLTVHVEANPAAGVVQSEDYKNWLQWIREQADEHVQQIQASAHSALNAAESASTSADSAVAAATSAITSKQETASLAAEVKAIFAGNGFYDKQESDSRYSPTIHQTVSGEMLALTDTVTANLQNLKLFGKTTQDGTPTPEAPLELVSVGNAGSITVCIGTSDMDESPQTLTISSPNGLPGIPVSSGGNYTDENGQQWACDEVDFARGVYIQNVQKVILDGMESWRTYGTFGYYFEFADIESIDSPMGVSDGSKSEQRLMCSHFAVQPKYVNIADRKHGMTVIYCSYNSGKCRISFDLEGTTMATYAAEQYAAGNPVTVLYQRAVPIETALSAEELAQYANAALHTNYPNTTVFNDSGAGMEVKYVADTKLYIDKKFDQLAVALVNNA